MKILTEQVVRMELMATVGERLRERGGDRERRERGRWRGREIHRVRKERGKERDR